MQSPQVTELSKHISGLKHRVQRGRLTFKEEKQLIKQMKELKEEKNQVITLVSNNQKRQDEKISCYMQTTKRDKMKTSFSLTEEIDNLMASKLDAKKKMKYFKQYLEDIDSKISYVFQKMETAISERDKTKELRRKSKELADKLNACDYKNLAVTKE
ncbi:hypothetical protein FCM35_KLT14554 [Carex littledalei]|uniref:Uncharacterized protein n=1 Tax=Carex littledalei TaxID=544730 RepID=A0A833QF11_9POAL|nr:hypothetical protein FCM35_KLT14554 [Carex littledalei]